MNRSIVPLLLLVGGGAVLCLRHWLSRVSLLLCLLCLRRFMGGDTVSPQPALVIACSVPWSAVGVGLVLVSSFLVWQSRIQHHVRNSNRTAVRDPE